MPIRFVALTTLLLTLASCAQTPVLQAPVVQTPGQPSPISAVAAAPGAALIGLPLATQTAAHLRPLSVSSGPVIGWGYDADGETDVPAGLVNPVAVAAGGFHSLSLQADGTVVAWGQGSRGQTTVPAGLSGVKAIAAGLYHSAALKKDGTVIGWGDDGYGQTDTPAGLGGITAIAAGANHTLALKADGNVVAWGNDGSGQTDVPAGLSGVRALSGGATFSAALKTDGTVVAWGDDSYGQTDVPAGLSGVTAIAAGAYDVLALKNDGTVVAWGFNGDGETDVPAGLRDVASISAGLYHSLALLKDGTVVTWGAASQGQDSLPAGLTNVAALSGGGFHTLALIRQTATDATPPVISSVLDPATPNGLNGWYTRPVTVRWSATDAQSSVSGSTGCDSSVLSTDTAGVTLTCSATSAGGTSSAAVSLKLDQTPPLLAPKFSAPGPVLLGAPLSVTPNASDSGSGLASATCAAPDTTSVGSKTLTCTAIDIAGNSVSRAVNYQVIYAFSGFTRPLRAAPQFNSARAGRTFTFRFSLAGQKALTVLAPGYPKVTPISCTATTAVPENASSFLAASKRGLLFRDESYAYSWKSPATAGCYQVNVRLNDGSDHVAFFNLRGKNGPRVNDDSDDGDSDD